MLFEEFKNNVIQWARARKIYSESNLGCQIAKTLEEVGELLTAKTDDEVMDAIGDIAVCLVNCAVFNGDEENDIYVGVSHRDSIGDLLKSMLDDLDHKHTFAILSNIAVNYNVSFNESIQKAWYEIKDRKGMMVNGMYVKWENLTEEQRAEFMRYHYPDNGGSENDQSSQW